MQPKAPPEEASILHSFDFTAIEEMDPSLGTRILSDSAIADGHKVIYDREVPFELRIQEPNAGPQEVGTLEAIKVKVLVLVLNSRRRIVGREPKPVLKTSGSN